MPIDLVIRPSISDHDLKVLTRLRQEFDRKLEKHEQLTPKEIIALGTHLWEALANAVDGGLEKIIALQQQAIASGTHVRLILESGEPDLQALPWEMTFHADQRLGFLSRNADFTLLRRWQPADEAMPDLPGGPLRILLFVASPEDLDPEKSRLDFETEQNFLFDQLDAGLSRGEVEIDVAEDGTLATLQARLESNVYHVVHCSMHGLMKDDRAVLAFEDSATGRQREVSPHELIDVWKKGKAPAPCFFLSACQSAQPDTQRAVPDFSRALLEAGVPHVIGMRRSVADTAATHFAGHFYHALAAGKPLDRAVTEARQKITGAASGAAKAPHELFIEVFQQWSIPVFYSRKPEPALLDGHKPFQPQPRPLLKKVQIGELAFTHEGFIGRRAAIRRHYRDWAAAKTPHLLLYGMGGVGKTALAGHFSLRLRRESPALQIFAFAPPFDLAAIEEQLRLPFLQAANKNQIENWQILDQAFDRLEVMLGALAARPTLFIFDNLESCLDLASRRFLPEHAATEALIAAAQRLSGAVRTLLTCRYAIVSDKLKNAALAELPEAGLGDILRFMRQWSWPETVTAEDKKAMYKTLGGNFRSIEWLSGLLTAAEETWARLQQKFVGLQPPAGTPAAATQTVLEAMRRDLVFDELLTLLTPAEKVLLQRLTLEPRPLIIDGLYALWDETGHLETAITHLNNYALLESAHAPHLALATYQIPPLVAELLSREPLTEALQRDTHARLGRYWRFAGRELTRQLSDDLAAFEHFTAAGLHGEADALLDKLSNEFQHRNEFGRVVMLLEQFVQRYDNVTPWWALNRLGRALHVLGKNETALQYLFRAQQLVQLSETTEKKEHLGITLNNIGRIHNTRGDYEKALEFFQKSLAIVQEIRHRKGEWATLNNIANLQKERGDYRAALTCLQKSLMITKEIGDHEGEATILNNVSQIHYAYGDYESAMQYLQKVLIIGHKTNDRVAEAVTFNNIASVAYKVGDYVSALVYFQKSLTISREIGDREAEGLTLNNLSQIYQARGDGTTAMSYLQKSLVIKKEISDRAGEAATLNNIAGILRVRGDGEMALNYLQESLSITKEIGNLAGQATALNNIACIYRARDDYKMAMEHSQKSLAIRRAINDRSGMISTLHNIANIHFENHQIEKAYENFFEALQLSRQTNNADGLFNVSRDLGHMLCMIGRKKEGLTLLQQALEVGEQMGHPRLSQVEKFLKNFN